MKLFPRSWTLAIGFLVAFVLIAGCAVYYYQYRTVYPVWYEQEAAAAAAEFDVPLSWVQAVIYAESKGDPKAVSHDGAVGLMQLLPSTAQWIAQDKLREPYQEAQLTDPATNARYGCWYLAYLYDRFGDWPTACAAYNAGPNRVDRWIKAEGGTVGIDPLREILIGETSAYVPQVVRAQSAYQRRLDRQAK